MAHFDDDDLPCYCKNQLCGYDKDRNPICPDPECGSYEHDLTCGDHGYTCRDCLTQFTCP